MARTRSRAVKRPRVGEFIDEGRHGVSEVLQVFAYGRELLIRDRIGREWHVERAEVGSWVYPDPA